MIGGPDLVSALGLGPGRHCPPTCPRPPKSVIIVCPFDWSSVRSQVRKTSANSHRESAPVVYDAHEPQSTAPASLIEAIIYLTVEVRPRARRPA